MVNEFRLATSVTLQSGFQDCFVVEAGRGRGENTGSAAHQARDTRQELGDVTLFQCFRHWVKLIPSVAFGKDLIDENEDCKQKYRHCAGWVRSPSEILNMVGRNALHGIHYPDHPVFGPRLKWGHVVGVLEYSMMRISPWYKKLISKQSLVVYKGHRSR
jgi:hypothetical protein